MSRWPIARWVKLGAREFVTATGRVSKPSDSPAGPRCAPHLTDWSASWHWVRAAPRFKSTSRPIPTEGAGVYQVDPSIDGCVHRGKALIRVDPAENARHSHAPQPDRKGLWSLEVKLPGWCRVGRRRAFLCRQARLRHTLTFSATFGVVRTFTPDPDCDSMFACQHCTRSASVSHLIGRLG